jgi:predicted nucleic acid-binding protein
MSHYIYWFPDNTVLINFACVSRLDLLEEILRGRGRWTEAIADEAQRSARFYPELSNVVRGAWLGEPIEVADREDQIAIERVRRAAFGGSAHEPRKHLGEAQTCHVIRTNPEFAASFWITDDYDAAEYAKRQGITTLDTQGLISEGIQDDCLHQPRRRIQAPTADGPARPGSPRAAAPIAAVNRHPQPNSAERYAEACHFWSRDLTCEE